MSITLSCCHKVEEFEDGVSLALKDQAIDFEEDKLVRSISYGEYCKECAAEYEKLDCILHNEKEEEDWLSGKMPDSEWKI